MSPRHRRRIAPPALAAALAASAAAAQAAPPNPSPPKADETSRTDVHVEAGRRRAAAFAALDAGRAAEAEANFDAAIALAPHDPGALGGLGVLRFRAGRLDEAERLLSRAVAHGGQAEWAKTLADVGYYRDLKTAEAARDAGDLPRARAIAGRLAASGLDRESLAKGLLTDIDLRQAVENQDSARAAWTAGDLAAADAAFKAAVAVAPQSPWARYHYARFLAWRGDPAAADAIIAPLAGSSDPDALFAAALHDNGARRADTAAALLDRIPPAGRTPAMTDFARSLQAELAVEAAQSLNRAGRGELARAGLRRLAADGELPTEAIARLADGLFAVDDHDGALALASRAQGRPLGEPYEYQGVVSVLGRSGRRDTAEALIDGLAPRATEPLQQVDVERLRARLVLANADWLSRKGEVKSAMDMLEAQRAKTPRDAELLSALGWTSLAGGDARLAQSAFTDLAAERPDDPNPWLGLAAAAGKQRRFAEADVALAHARRLAPANPEVYVAAAAASEAQGRPRVALINLRRAGELRARLAETDPFAELAPQVQSRVRPVFAGLQVAELRQTAADNRLRDEIEALADAADSRGETGLEHLAHTGDPGLSRLRIDRASLLGSARVGGGRMDAKLRLVEADSGRASLVPGASARRRDRGAELLGGYARGGFRGEIGVTPLGFQGATVQGEAAWAGQVAPDLQAKAWVERRPVADSLVSYAGGRTAAGERWGRVSRTGGGGGLTVTRNEAGVYATFAGFAYTGRKVRDNSSVKADVGAYAGFRSKAGIKLSGGLNIDYQAFDHNENAFVVAHGGYFSPQRFVSVAAPLRLSARHGPWTVEAEASPGYQSYRQDAFAPGAARQTKSGFGASAGLKIDRELRPGLVLGGDLGVNTFGAYRETRIGLRLRARFGDHGR